MTIWYGIGWLVGWSLTSLFSTNAVISETSKLVGTWLILSNGYIEAWAKSVGLRVPSADWNIRERIELCGATTVPLKPTSIFGGPRSEKSNEEAHW